MLHFTNTYSALPERFYQRINPESSKNSILLHFNEVLADELGIPAGQIPDRELELIFSGQKIPPGAEPMALVYAAHQFGNWVPRLGDGRAHLLGEVNGYDIQLKGSGRTLFSRNGDGRSALGPVIREYIVSEAMHNLGVPTTRALAAVATGDDVHRQFGPEPGGIFTRVAESHLRVGTFQYFAARQDIEALEMLLSYSINRHYPELKEFFTTREQALEFLKAVGRKQADLIARWMSYGFIHGVMNTDNFSIAGITLDYGPCAFIDEYQADKVFSSIDRHGRYRYSNQISMAQWNIMRLSECLIPLIDPDHRQSEERISTELAEIMNQFNEKRIAAFSQKLGLSGSDPETADLIDDFLQYLEKEDLDFTMSFRNLPDLFAGNQTFYRESPGLKDFLDRWKAMNPVIEGLNSVNPLYIARNHMVQRAIDHSYQGDYDLFRQMVQVLNEPFTAREEFKRFALPPEPGERVCQTFCGT